MPARDFEPVIRARRDPLAPSRYGDRPVAAERIKSLGLTVAVYMSAPLLVLILSARYAQPSPPAPVALSTLKVMTLAAPPRPIREVKEGKEQIAWPKVEPLPARPPAPLIRLPVPSPAARERPSPVETTRVEQPQVLETTAPPAIPAPPAAILSSDAKDSWEAKLLAHLQRHRRYPYAASDRRLQGVTHVRFRMNRSGTVLTLAIVRSSGSLILDKAALDTLRRAQPLPAIPATLPDEVELAIPIEFFLR